MASSEGLDLQLQIVPNDDGQVKISLSSPDSNPGAPAAAAQDDMFVIEQNSPNAGSDVFLSPKEDPGNDSKFTLGDDDTPTAADDPDTTAASPPEDPPAPSQEALQDVSLDTAGPEQRQEAEEQPQEVLLAEPLREEPAWPEVVQAEQQLSEQQLQDEPLHDEPLQQDPPAAAAAAAAPPAAGAAAAAQEDEEAGLPEEPLQEEPLLEEPLQEEPLEEEPLHEEPLQEEPLQEEPLHEEPLQEEPLQEEPLQEEPLHEEPLQEEPLQEEPLHEEPLQEEPPAEQPAPMAPMQPPPSPFFPVPASANGPSSSTGAPQPQVTERSVTTTQPQVTERSVPTSQNGTAEFSPPSSPHPLDNIKPPSILQVDASYQGLVFSDGYDTHGRPVIVLNTSALPPKSRKEEALTYLREQLSPIVNQGPYVLVLLACGTGPKYKSLPSLWTVSAYRSLARPFHKNVKFIIMVNPSLLVRCVLAVVKPFVKKKAYHKLKQVKALEEIDLVTNSEVRREHLGHAFLSYVQRQQQGSQQEGAE